MTDKPSSKLDENLSNIGRECVHDIQKVYDAAMGTTKELIVLSKLNKTRLIAHVSFYIAMICVVISGVGLLLRIVRVF